MVPSKIALFCVGGYKEQMPNSGQFDKQGLDILMDVFCANVRRN